MLLPLCYIECMMYNYLRIKPFGDICAAFIQMINNIYKSASQIDFVCHSYLDGSIKDSERMRRQSPNQ